MEYIMASSVQWGLKSSPLVYPAIPSGCTQILLIDRNIKDYSIFVESVNSSTLPIVYSMSSTKVELLALLKTNFPTISRIGIAFDSNAYFFLDRKPFFARNEVAPYSENVEFILSIIREFGVQHIDYLACDTMNSPKWMNYYGILSKETTVIVGASNNKTGNLLYGGDWILESTSENVELLYFTKSIEYYKYLLDVLGWATGLNGPAGMVVYGDYMYVGCFSGDIVKINLSDGSIANSSWASSVIEGSISDLVIDGDYMYASILNVDGPYTGSIVKIQLSDGTILDYSWASSLDSPFGMVIYDGYLYASISGFFNSPNSIISQIQLSDGNITNAYWATGFNVPGWMIIYNSDLYVANLNDITISRVSLVDGSIIQYDWATGLVNPIGLAIYGDYMYAANLNYSSGTTISQIALSDGSIVNYAWASSAPGSWGLVIYGDKLYLSNVNNGTIDQFDLVPPSNICFPAGTPIQTDQGIIPIHKIITGKHTLDKKPIRHVTKTTISDEYLVSFAKGSLGTNCPSEKTVMTKNHKVFFNGEMKEADDLLYGTAVYKTKYRGEILYNILLDEPYFMRVNNLICETLHPDNMIAKYTRLSKEMKPVIFNMLTESQKNKHFKTYNKITKQM